MAFTGYGAFAEEVKTEESRLLPMPAGMDFPTAAAFILTYGTSDHALSDRGALQPGETLLVLGAAGGVGLAAIEIGKVLGARVIACASTDEKLAVCRAHGADETINYADRGSARADQGADRRPRRRRRLRRGRRAVHRAGAALDSRGAAACSSSASRPARSRRSRST